MAQKLKKLEPKHAQAVRLRVEGRGAVEIAKALGVKPQSVRRWICDPLFAAEVEKVQSEVGKLFAEKLAESGLQTLDVMKQMLEMPISGKIDPETGEVAEREYLSFSERMQIIDRFLDRNPHTNPPAPANGDGEGTVLPEGVQNQLNLLVGMNTPELLEILAGIVSRNRQPQAIEAKAK